MNFNFLFANRQVRGHSCKADEERPYEPNLASSKLWSIESNALLGLSQLQQPLSFCPEISSSSQTFSGEQNSKNGALKILTYSTTVHFERRGVVDRT